MNFNNLLVKFEKQHLIDLIFFLLIFLISFSIRWIDINTVPFGIEGDELSWIVTSYISKFNVRSEDIGMWSMHSSVADSFPVSILINRLGFKIFGHDILSSRKILVLTSSLSLGVFYLLCRQFFNSLLSFFTTLIFSISYFKLIVTKIADVQSFSDLFIYPNFLFLLKLAHPNNKKKIIIYSFFSGSFLVLSMLTYNFAFFLLFINLFFLFYFFFKKKSWKEFVLVLLFFLLPICFFSKKTYKNFILEYQRKKYALGNSVIDFDKKKFKFDQLKKNIFISKNILFKGLTYETSDMIVNYNATLIPRSIVVFSLLGFFFSIIFFKKFLLIFLWYLISFFLIIFGGFFLPRMFINLAGSFFLMAGVFFYFINLFFRRISILFFYLIYFLFLNIYFLFNFRVYYSQAINNPSFKKDIREINDFLKKEKNQFNKIIFISKEKIFRDQVIYPLVFFYFFVDKYHPIKIKKEELAIFRNVYTLEEILKFVSINGNNYKNKYYYIENEIVNDFSFLTKKNLKLLKKGVFFSKYYLF